ncbi:MAG TPA: hypothetical protein VGE07_20460 [Herpetosiphonaceae bacterium]
MRYRVGWPFPGRVLALIHFSSDVTAEDYAGIMAAAGAELAQADQPFHLLIDNSRLADETIAGLDDMLAAAPALRHEHLRWIVVVLPDSIKRRAPRMAVQRNGGIQLKYVDSVYYAIRFLLTIDESMREAKSAIAFWQPPAPPA